MGSAGDIFDLGIEGVGLFSTHHFLLFRITNIFGQVDSAFPNKISPADFREKYYSISIILVGARGYLAPSPP